jgi:ATP-dependent DNA helicase RecQ
LFENSKNIPDLDKSFYLAHYKPRSRGGNDRLSSYLLSFKDGNKDAVKHWIQYAKGEFKKSELKFDVVIRALGSQEISYTPGHPLDELGQEIARLTKAKYTPQILQKKHANEPLKRLSAAGRHEALRGIFNFDPGSIAENAKILIIDDVITTGATIKEICRTIKASRPDVVTHLFTLTKTYDSFRDQDQNDTILKSIITSKPIVKKLPIPRPQVIQSDSIQEYGAFFLESIQNHFPFETSSELKSLLIELSCFDIKSTKPLEPEPLSPELSSPFDVLYNIIQRGLPTRPSLQIEDKFQEVFNLFQTEESLGGISFRVKPVKQNLGQKLIDALYLVDPRIDISDLTFQYTYSWERLDSEFEEDFYLNRLSNISGPTPWLIQYVQPQRSISSIVKDPSSNTRLQQNFIDQRCDFAIEFPTKINGRKGIVIEVDGPHHEDAGQKELDRNRDQAVYRAGWSPTLRIPVQNWSQMEEYLQGFVNITQSKYFTKVAKNYSSPLYDSDSGLIALQLMLSPVLIGRIQKTLLRAILDKHLDLQSERWNICIIERDVPGSSLAIRDLFEHANHLSKLVEKGFNLPTTDIQIYSTEKFIGARLHKFSQDKPSPIKNIEQDFNHYDLIIDVSVLSRIDFWKPAPFPVAPDSYLLLKSSMYNETKRKFRTGKLLEYKNLTSKVVVNGKEEEREKPELRKELEYFLVNIFRKNKLRPGQIPILDRALRHKSVIGLLPTGGGKSLTYQLSTLLQPGITLIVDPIKSLMRDQVNSLSIHHIDCSDFVNSSLNRREKETANKRVTTGDVLFFFISPERLQLQDFRDVLSASQSYENYFSFAVIDEAHCVSEWGHDFRTSYLFLGKNTKRFARTNSETGVTLLGLTATASYDVLADIQRELADDIDNLDSILSDDAVVRFETFNRPEIQYEVIPATISNTGPFVNEFTAREDLGRSKHAEIIKLIDLLPNRIEALNNDPNSVYIPITEIDATPDKANLFEKIHLKSYDPKNFWNEQNSNAGIIFCPHRSWYFGVTDKFNNKKKSKVGIYDSIIARKPEFEERSGTFFGSGDTDNSSIIETVNIKNQVDFTNNQISLMIATKAFGMGIDKPNVRFSIHLNYPESLESFVQEAGRIGRDGKTAVACVVYNDQSFQIGPKDQPGKAVNFDREILNNFYKSSFPGVNKEKSTLLELLSVIPILPIKNLDLLSDKIKQKTTEEFRFELKTSQIGNEYLVVHNSVRNQIGIIFLDDFRIKPNSTNISVDESTYLLNSIAEEMLLLAPERDSISAWLKVSQGNPKAGIEDLLSEMSLGESRIIQVAFTNDIDALENLVLEIFNKSGMQNVSKLLRDYRSTNSIDTFLESVSKVDKQGQDIIKRCYNSQRDKQDTEKALYRLALVGVVSDYTIDFNRRIFNVTISKRSPEEYEKYLRAYIRRYYSDNKTDKILSGIHKRKGKNYIQQSLNFITEFLYEEIAKKRWKAIDAVQEACRVGVQQGNGPMKEYIDVYFNSKYGRREYTYEYDNKVLNGSLAERTDDGKTGDLGVVWEFISIATELDKSGAELVNLKHLRGACVRFLNPNPNNFALLLLKAFSTLILEEIRVKISTLIPEAIKEISEGLEIMITDEKVSMAEITETIHRYFELLLQNTSSTELKQKLSEIKIYQIAHSNRMWLQSFNERFLDQDE